MLRNYNHINACGLESQPEFLELPEQAKKLYYSLYRNAGLLGIVKHPKDIRNKEGASDDDVRALIRGGHVLALPEGQIMIIRCPHHRRWIEEYYKCNGHQPTMAELEEVFG